MILIAKLFTRITGNTQHLLYPLLPLNSSTSILSLFVKSQLSTSWWHISS